MADGKDQDQSNPYGAAIQVPNFPPVRDTIERSFGMANTEEGSPLDKALQQHHAERLAQTQMYRDVLASALGQLHKGTKWDSTINNGLGGERPLTPDEENTLRAQIDYGRNQYGKMIGVNPQTKEAVSKANQIIDFIMGHKRQQQQAAQAQGSMGAAPAPAAPPPTPQYPTNVSDTGVSYLPNDRPGGLPPPPTPNYPTTISDAGVSFKSPPTPTGGGATAMVPPVAAYTDANGLYHPALKHRSAAELENAAAPAPTPSPAATPAARKPFTMDALELSLMAPVEAHKLGVSQKIEDVQRAYAQQHAQWRAEAEQLWPKDSWEYKYYSATGQLPKNFPPRPPRPAGSYTMSVLDARDLAARTGQVLLDTNGNPIDLDNLNNSMGLKGMQVWNQDNGRYEVRYEPFSPNQAQVNVGNEVYAVSPMDKERLSAGAGTALGPQHVPSTSTHTAPGVTLSGEIGPVTTSTTKTPSTTGVTGRTQTPGVTNRQIATPPPAPQGPSKTGAISGTPATSQAQPAHSSIVGSGPVPHKAGGYSNEQAIPFPAANQLNQRIIPVREAATQLFGDPTQPEFKGFQEYADLADKDTPERQALANAVRLTFNHMKDQEKSQGSLWTVLGNYAGKPQLLVDSETNVMRDAVGKLSPQNQEAYNAIMSAYGTIMGLRALTKAGAYQFSVEALEREVPLPGINTFSKAQFYDKMSRLAEVVYNGSKTVPLPKQEKDFYASKVKEYRSKAGGGGSSNRQVATPPPTPGGSIKTSDDLLKKYGINK